MESPRVFEATHRLRAGMARGGQDRRAAHRPPRWTVRSGAVLPPAAGARRQSDRGRKRCRAGGARDLRRRRENTGRTGAPAARLAGVRHDRLRVLRAVERRVRRSVRRDFARAHLSRFHRPDAGLRDAALPVQAPDHAHRTGRRAQRAGQRAAAHRRDRSPHVRLHLQQPALRAARSGRELSGLSHLRRTRAMSPRSTGCTSSRRWMPRKQPQPCGRCERVRFRARSHADGDRRRQGRGLSRGGDLVRHEAAAVHRRR